MAIPKEAFEALQAIVGPEWVSDDPAICAADRTGGAGEGMSDLNAINPACSIQPKTGEEVAEIVKVANRYHLPYIPTATFLVAADATSLENTIFMDLKRMEKLEIYEDDMYAVCEPGVAYVMLQAELLKRGLFTFVTGSGSNCSVVANQTFSGDAPTGWRHGLGYRRILAVEWVLPDGQLIKLGTRATSDEYFWGEGPGPDLRGIMRGNIGYAGGLGVITKMAVKIFSLVPDQPVPEGLGPSATFHLPENRFRWFNCRFPQIKQLAEACYELGKCEIALICMHMDPSFGYVARARGKGANYFWKEWTKAKETINPESGWLRVLLCGFTSEKQLDYEEKVLTSIVQEYGGTIKLTKPYDESNLQACDAISANFAARRFQSVLSFESIDHAVRVGRDNAKIKNQFIPPLPDSYNLPGWYVPYDFGHCCKVENLSFGDIPDVPFLGKWLETCMRHEMETGAYPWAEDPNMFGPNIYDYHLKLGALKKMFDPNNLSNPPKPLSAL
jgi:hypothetical protein